MVKTKEELEALKKEYQDLKKKLEELDEEELMSIAGGNEDIDVGHFTEWEILPTILNTSKQK